MRGDVRGQAGLARRADLERKRGAAVHRAARTVLAGGEGLGEQPVGEPEARFALARFAGHQSGSASGVDRLGGGLLVDVRGGGEQGEVDRAAQQRRRDDDGACHVRKLRQQRADQVRDGHRWPVARGGQVEQQR